MIQISNKTNQTCKIYGTRMNQAWKGSHLLKEYLRKKYIKNITNIHRETIMTIWMKLHRTFLIEVSLIQRRFQGMVMLKIYQIHYICQVIKYLRLGNESKQKLESRKKKITQNLLKNI